MSPNRDRQDDSPARHFDWSNRILLPAVAGILFLTLYPFQFSSHGKPHRGISPLMLGYGAKSGGLDVFLNILLFIPLGFALGSKLLRHKNRKSSLLYSWLAGGVLSYSIELAQLYIPQRDSGWQDVFTNSTGAVTGCLLFMLFGVWAFRHLSDLQSFVEERLTAGRLALILVAYFGVWSVVSVSLSKELRLDSWKGDCFLVVGDRAGTARVSADELSKLEIWNQALPKNDAERVTGGHEDPAENPTAAFDFQTEPPREDQNSKFPVALAAGPDGVSRRGPNDGRFEVSSRKPVTDLVDSIKRTSQFSIRAVLKQQERAGSNGSIVALKLPGPYWNLYLGQNGDDLIFGFRSSALSRRHTLLWKMAKVPAADGSSDILFSYNGSELAYYANGREIESYRLGPEIALASRFRHLRTAELGGYRDIYYALMFFPAGVLLGIASTKRRWRRLELASLLVLEGLLAPLAFQWILMDMSGSSFSSANFGFSVGMIALGFLWAKSDRAAEMKEAAVSS
jgi:VanZ like family